MTTPGEQVALYRLRDSDGRLLYVGVAGEPQRRFAEHRRSKHWWPTVATHELTWCPSLSAALDAEAEAIHHEKPVHNILRPSTFDPSQAQRIMGSFEVSRMLGINRQRLNQLAGTTDFPEPWARLAAGTVWAGEDIVHWAESHRRMPIGPDLHR